MQSLKNKVVAVTGGASGLGKAIVQRLAAEGATAVITDIEASTGEATAAELRCDFLQHDVTDEAQWSYVSDAIRRRHGGLHVLVNNAGIVAAGEAVSPEDTSLADWRRVFAVNVEGVFLGCRAAIPAIHASGGGSIINISSVAGLLATPYATAYGASKATVRQLTKSVAQHCIERKYKIRCNSVHPGPIRTGLWDKHAADTARKRGVSIETIVNEIEAAVPMGEFTRAEDVAAMVAFLASEEARHITGAEMIVDGGVINCDTYHMGFARQ